MKTKQEYLKLALEQLGYGFSGLYGADDRAEVLELRDRVDELETIITVASLKLMEKGFPVMALALADHMENGFDKP